MKSFVAALEEKFGSRKARFFKLGVGLLLGAGAGYAYYALVGCSSGGCPITSNPFISTGYGAIMGGLVTGWK